MRKRKTGSIKAGPGSPCSKFSTDDESRAVEGVCSTSKKAPGPDILTNNIWGLIQQVRMSSVCYGDDTFLEADYDSVAAMNCALTIPDSSKRSSYNLRYRRQKQCYLQSGKSTGSPSLNCVE